MAKIKDETRWVADIGMQALDRPRFGKRSTCSEHATDFCKVACYNTKLEKLYPAMLVKDERNEDFWEQVDGDTMALILGRKKKSMKRFRGCTRGENFATYEDILKWQDICLKNPSTQFWLPTHAWWSPAFSKLNPFFVTHLEKILFPIPNAHVLASIDPANQAGWAEIEKRGWSTMFFGDDSLDVSPAGEKLFKCPKTFKQLKGHCGICKAGCFAKNLGRQVNVHLEGH